MVNGMNSHNRIKRREETLPAVQVQYWADTDILQIHTGEIKGDWETLGQGLVAYYDSEGTVTGFWIDGASSVLKPIIDALGGSHETESARGNAGSVR